MKRSLYRERDYAFGQLMLTLRTHLGLTQASLAKLLRVSRRAVSTWELGSHYPASAHLQELLVLGMRASAFPAGHEEQEIRAFWRAAHQKVLLDERWLQGLLGTQHPRLVLVAAQSDEPTNADVQAVAQPARGPRVEWGEALDVPAFYGREQELARLSQWVVSALSWARSGELVLSGGSDGMVRWWEVQCVRVREAHQGTVQSLKVSPDGSRLASCGDDGAIVLWDLESGEPFQTLRQDRPYERLDITGIRGLSAAQKASLHALGAFEERSGGGELPALPAERGMTT